MKNAIVLVIIVMGFLQSYGQESFQFSDRMEHYRMGKSLFDESLYGLAQIELQKVYMEDVIPVNGKYDKLQREAKLLFHIASLRLETPEAENDLVNFINTYSPDPITSDAILELASYYYNEKQYQSAIDYYDKIDISLLEGEAMSEASFKKGYCQFVLKDFGVAKSTLKRSKEYRNKFYYPVNYYYGMCQYFLGEYDGAVESFDRVSNATLYKPHIPYYITQIYFAQGKVDQLINYAEQNLARSDVRKEKEIRLLLGQSYFQRNQYKKALPHLVYYEANTNKLTEDEFYQLAFAQYQTEDYDGAIENFKELALLDSKLGQVANYYLADSYMKTGDLVSARSAFKKVSQMTFEKSMQAESIFNYGKLTAEMGFDREAINTLITIDELSPFHTETQSIINDVLLNSGDFANSIMIIESLDKLTPKLESTYQIVCFKRGLQLYQENNLEDADVHFQKALEYKYDRSTEAQTRYWIANIANNKNDYKSSVGLFENYFDVANGLNGLPEESSIYMANYVQADNYLKLKEYKKAEFHYKNAIVGINLNRTEIQNAAILERVLPDAFIMAGDCLFTEGQYIDAKKYYDQSIERKQAGYVYALYQRALIEGLQGQMYEKLLTLESIRDKHPGSDYADDALKELGDTYFRMGNTLPASLAFQKLVNEYKGKTPFLNTAYLRLGLITYNQGDIHKSLAYYKEVFKNNPNSSESQQALLAIEEIYIENLSKTEDYFAFLETIPGYKVSAFAKDSLNYKIAEIQYSNGNYQVAIGKFDDYLKTFGKGYYRLEARYYRAECNALLKKYSNALSDYEFLVKEGFNDYYESSLKKAAIISYNHAQDFDKAYKYYDMLSGFTSADDDKYQSQLGALRSAFRIGKEDETLKYARLVQANPLGTIEEKSTAQYYLGKVSYRQNNLEQAVAAFTKVSDHSNNNQAAEARYLIAEIYFKQKNMELAEQQANQANELNRNYPFWIAKSLLLLSDIFVARDDLFNARAALEAVLENFKNDEGLQKAAEDKLKQVSTMEEKGSRIKTERPDGTLELDSTGN